MAPLARRQPDVNGVKPEGKPAWGVVFGRPKGDHSSDKHRRENRFAPEHRMSTPKPRHSAIGPRLGVCLALSDGQGVQDVTGKPGQI